VSEFKTGDMAEIVKDLTGSFPHLIGQECEIVEDAGTFQVLEGGVPTIIHGYVGEIMNGDIYIFLREELRKIEPPIDGRALARWIDGPFQPAQVRA
jgi:hypothetical protein